MTDPAARSQRRPRVLVIAEAANPEWVSVPLVGWSLATALRSVADVHIVTQVRNRDAFLRAGETEGETFTAIDSEAVAAPLWKIGGALRMGEGRGWTALQAVSALCYPYFERLVWQQFGAGIRAGHWDVVHRITPLSPTQPSSLAPRVAAAGVPFVLGPLNGGVPWPAGFSAERRAEREWLGYLRGAYRLLPGGGATHAAASAILAGSWHTASEIPARHRDKVVWLPENAVDPARFSLRAEPGRGRPLRAVFVGRLVPYKGCDMLIAAAAPLLAAGTLALDIVGDGPMRGALEARARAVGGEVRFHGWMAHDAVQTVMAGGDLLAFPSIREFGGGVVLEAMALGLPPLVVDYAGPGELVRPGLGLTVPVGPRAAIVADLRAALGRLVDDPAPLAALGRAAAEEVARHFTWAQKARQVARVYDWVRRADGTPAPELFSR